MNIFQKDLVLSVPREALFHWHEMPGAFTRLNPPWRPVTLLEEHQGIQDGNEVLLKLPVMPLRWRLRHQGYVKNEKFEDLQVRGPFRSWHHQHLFFDSPQGSMLRDTIEYELPLPVNRFLFKPELARLFGYRHAITKHDILRHFEDREGKKLHVLVTGASGMIGQQLCSFLLGGGHRVTSIGRRKPSDYSHHLDWDYKDVRSIDLSNIPPIDAVYHLAGENIADGRWSEKRKAQLVASRVVSTENLCWVLARDNRLPEVFICASGVGFYGSCGDSVLKEDAAQGQGFLAELAQQWEQASAGLKPLGVRVVHTRFGVVLSAKGGALKKMLPAFLLGMGLKLGSGRQYLSWIGVEDLLSSLLFVARTKSISGACNLCSPEPVTNGAFSELLGKVLHRPVLGKMPAFLVKTLLGQMGEETLLGSQRAVPSKLQSSGFAFMFPEIEQTLRLTLGKTI